MTTHDVSLQFPALWVLQVAFQEKNNVTNALLTLHLPKCRTEAIAHVLQFITSVAVEKELEQKSDKW